MSQELETPVQEAPKTTETVVTQANPFDESSWKETPTIAHEINQQQTQQQTQTTTTTEKKEEENAIDANEWLKQKFGWENEELGKKEIEELRRFKEESEKTPRFKFTDAIKEKEAELSNYFSERSKFDRVEKMDISKAQEAAEILKLDLYYKNKDKGLTQDEIDYLFNKNFQLPPKPVQTDDMLDEDYERAVANWKQDVEMKERGMIIEAKMAKPEILKYREGLTPPEIELYSEGKPTQQGPTPEELAAFKQGRTAYLNDVNKGLNDFNGFNATYKDEAVEIPISYTVTPEEKESLKSKIESLYGGWDYFVNRWANADGSFNGLKIARDLYLLENEGKVIQKFTNEAGSQVNLHRMKQKSNIQLNTDATRTNVPSDQASLLEKQIQTIWDA